MSKLFDIEQVQRCLTKLRHDCQYGDPLANNRHEYVSCIFDLTTYSPEIDLALVDRIMAALSNIYSRKVLDLNDDALIDHMAVINMIDIGDWLNWGTSIFSAWLSTYPQLPEISTLFPVRYPNPAALYPAMVVFLYEHDRPELVMSLWSATLTRYEAAIAEIDRSLDYYTKNFWTRYPQKYEQSPHEKEIIANRTAIVQEMEQVDSWFSVLPITEEDVPHEP